MGRRQSNSRWSRTREVLAAIIGTLFAVWLTRYFHLRRTESTLLLLFCFLGAYFALVVLSFACTGIVTWCYLIFPACQTKVRSPGSEKHVSTST